MPDPTLSYLAFQFFHSLIEEAFEKVDQRIVKTQSMVGEGGDDGSVGNSRVEEVQIREREEFARERTRDGLYKRWTLSYYHMFCHSIRPPRTFRADSLAY